MLISHRYQFIFIKTRKTAGTSIELDLSQVMSCDDIATPIFPKEENHIPRNYKFGEIEFYNHIGARQVRDVIGSQVFESYFKFCVEREPVEKCISHYYMLNNSPAHNPFGKPISWSEYVELRDFPVDTDKYTDGQGNLIVDKIVRYEKLNDELSDIFKRLGIPCDSIRSFAKSKYRKVGQKPSDLSLSHCSIIYAAFESSNAHTGYLLKDFHE